MKAYIIILLFLSFLTLRAEDGILAKAGYNSNSALAEKVQSVDNALAFFACVGCHNGKATYSVILKEGEDFKLKYYGASKAKLSDMGKDFSLKGEDVSALLEILSKEISQAKEISMHKEGAKRGSSFEFAVKDGDKWNLAGHYSKGAYPLITKIASLLKAKNQADVDSKMKQIIIPQG